MLHDLNTIAPPWTAESSKISPRSAESGPDAFITEEASSTPPRRIEVRSMYIVYAGRGIAGKPPLSARRATARFESIV